MDSHIVQMPPAPRKGYAIHVNETGEWIFHKVEKYVQADQDIETAIPPYPPAPKKRRYQQYVNEEWVLKEVVVE